MVVGFVGKAGSGKSTAAERIAKSEIKLISLDRLGHDSLKEERESLVNSFGRGILTCSNVDRKKLSRIVFENPDLLTKLNKILHPVIKRKALEIVGRDCSDHYIFDGALIHEIGLEEYCDKIIWFECPDEMAIERLMKRGISKSRAESILASQQYLDPIKESVDAVVTTSGSIEGTFEKVRSILFEWGIVV
ncbi:MAG: dephospho-CoA kinase [Kosmotogaceae bacterium]|nr:dephospho-CoA kinase [Kosmotogaceae bacterium]